MLSPSSSRVPIAGMPAGVAGTFTIRFGRFTAFQRRRASSSVPFVSLAKRGDSEKRLADRYRLSGCAKEKISGRFAGRGISSRGRPESRNSREPGKGMMRILGDLWQFFLRDLRIARTYRSPFILEAVEALFAAAMFFYGARFVDSPELRASLPQGHSYFAYALVGFVFFDYLTAALDTFDRTLQEARDTGTLEPLLVTQVSLPLVLAGSFLYPFAATTLRIIVYLGWGALLFGFPLGAANWLSVIAVVLITLLAFSALGIFSASYLLLFKRGNPGN